MTQEKINWLPPVAHRDDPATSHEAAESIDRGKDIDAVLRSVTRLPNATGSEHAKALGWEIYRVRRRLSDLHNQGKIERGNPRLAAGRTRAECVWRVTGGTP